MPYISPKIKTTGFYLDLSFMFDLIPINRTTVKRRDTYKEYTQSSFSKFNPSFFYEFGFSAGKGKLNYSIGLIITSFDPFIGYRKLYVGGNPIGSFIPNKAVFWGVTIKVSFLDI